MAATVVALLLAASTPAQAQDPAQMRQKIQSFTLKLADLEKADEDKGAIKELKLTQLWLNDAQALLVQEEEEDASKLLRRAEVSIDMIEKLIIKAKEQAKAEERESAAVQMEQAANEAKIKLEQAKARKKQLQTELSGNATEDKPQ
ncbi:MAG: hypothetical protein AAFS10_03780 [Myxococcota bacterium]